MQDQRDPVRFVSDSRRGVMTLAEACPQVKGFIKATHDVAAVELSHPPPRSRWLRAALLV